MKYLAIFVCCATTAMTAEPPAIPVGGGAQVLSEGLPLQRSNAVFLPRLPRIFVDGEEVTQGPDKLQLLFQRVIFWVHPHLCLSYRQIFQIGMHGTVRHLRGENLKPQICLDKMVV